MATVVYILQLRYWAMWDKYKLRETNLSGLQTINQTTDVLNDFPRVFPTVYLITVKLR